jgi:hypothetical protein
MKSRDPKYQRDRDQWPLFRLKSAAALLKKVDAFVDYVEVRGHRPVVCLYFHPWDFHEMPTGAIDFGEASVRPLSWITRNCGKKALTAFDQLCKGLLKRRARFMTAKDLARRY